MEARALAPAARRLGVELSTSQVQALEHYVALLKRWNAKFNLISRQDMVRVWPRHVLDSLSVLPLIRQTLAGSGRGLRAMDLGSGAGFPGLPLAVADPGIDWLLVDRSARKARFLEMVTRDLALGNVRVSCVDLQTSAAPSRAVSPDQGFDLITSRAVAGPERLTELAGGLLNRGGALLALSGAVTGGQAAAQQAAAQQAAAQAGETAGADLPQAFVVESVQRLQIPGLDRIHEVTIIRHSG